MIGVGTCENLIRGSRDDWADAEYCGAPAIDLGIPGVRNICQSCHQHTQDFRLDLIGRWALDMAGDQSWISMTREYIAEAEAKITSILAGGGRMSDVASRRRDVQRRSDLLAAVLAAGVAS